MISSKIHSPETNALLFILTVSHTHYVYCIYNIYNDIVYIYIYTLFSFLSICSPIPKAESMPWIS